MKNIKPTFLYVLFPLIVFSCFEIKPIEPPRKVKVELPEVNYTDIENNSIFVIIKKNNETYIKIGNNKYIFSDSLMNTIIDSSSNPAINLYGDQEADYGKVYEIINYAKKNKLKISLMSKPTDEKS